MRSRPPRRARTGPKSLCGARAARVQFGGTQAKRGAIALNPRRFRAVRPGGRVRFGKPAAANPRWLGVITPISASPIYRTCANAKTLSRVHPTFANTYQRESGMPNSRQRENVRSDGSDFLKRPSACAAKARPGFVAGACDKLELPASTEEAPSSDGRITPASRQTSKRAHRLLRPALWIRTRVRMSLPCEFAGSGIIIITLSRWRETRHFDRSAMTPSSLVQAAPGSGPPKLPNRRGFGPEEGLSSECRAYKYAAHVWLSWGAS